jgi:sugar/nucleoside kinase (ribokinase family)
LLDKYGLAFGVPGELTEDQIPVLKDLESMEGYHEMPGGSSINTLRAINYHMRKEQARDGTTLYFGSIAKDDKGSIIKQLLEEETIRIRMNEHDSGYTGQCAIVIVKGERTPVSNSGVNENFETHYFEDNIDSLSPCKMIYVEGFFTSSNYEVIRKAYEYAKENNKLFAFNLCGEYWVETYKEIFTEIIPN